MMPPSTSLVPPSDDATASVPPNTLNAMVAALEEDIVFGRLHPRERLVEDELMERFNAKRHIARDALAALDRMGLIERRRNVGALVRSFSAKEVEELFELRGLLESEAARRIELPVAPDRLDRLIAVQRRHDAAVANSDAPQVFRSNLAFHEELFSLGRNEALRKAIAEYARQTHPIRFAALVSASYREHSRQEHWKMIEALRAGDQDCLVALCSSHILPSRDAYLEAERLRQLS